MDEQNREHGICQITAERSSVPQGLRGRPDRDLPSFLTRGLMACVLSGYLWKSVCQTEDGR